MSHTGCLLLVAFCAAVLREAEKLMTLTDLKPDEVNRLILDKVAASHIQLLNAADDTQSHFILRLAFCHSEDLRRWLCDMECRLLRSVHPFDHLAGYLAGCSRSFGVLI